MLTANKSNNILLFWIVDRLVQDLVRHIAFSHCERRDLLGFDKLQGSHWESPKILTLQEGGTLDTTVLEVSSKPICSLKKHPILQFVQQLLVLIRAGERTEAGHKLFI